MTRSWYWRLAIVLLVAIGAVWFLVPSYYSFFVLPKDQRNNVKLLEQKLPFWAKPIAGDRLRLGLDLQGGIHMVMRVDTKTALQKRVERRGITIASYLKEKGYGDVTYDANPEKLELTLTVPDASKLDAAAKEATKDFGDFTLVSKQGNQIVLSLNDNQINRFQQDAVDQAMLVIRRRIDKWGV